MLTISLSHTSLLHLITPPPIAYLYTWQFLFCHHFSLFSTSLLFNSLYSVTCTTLLVWLNSLLLFYFLPASYHSSLASLLFPSLAHFSTSLSLSLSLFSCPQLTTTVSGRPTLATCRKWSWFHGSCFVYMMTNSLTPSWNQYVMWSMHFSAVTPLKKI